MPVNSVNTAFQGVLSNDKSVICLPRHSSCANLLNRQFSGKASQDIVVQNFYTTKYTANRRKMMLVK